MALWKMNWSDERVAGALDDYRTRKIQTLEELQATLEEITGTSVSKKTLSLRVRGICADRNMAQSSNRGNLPQKEGNEGSEDDDDDDDDHPMLAEESVEEKQKFDSDDDSDVDEGASSSLTTNKEKATSGATAAAVDDGLVLSDLLSKKIVLANGEIAHRINSQRCRAHLGYRGFIYAPVSQIRGTQAIRWRCLNARNSCSAFVTTDKDFTKVTMGPNGHGEHCSPDEIGVRLKAAINDIKISAEFWTGSMRDLYNEFTDSLARTDPRVLSVFPTIDTHALLKSMNNHRTSQICRKQFLLDKQEVQRRERTTATVRKRRLAENDKKLLFPETICCECGEIVGDQSNLITHLQTVHERTDLKIESYEFPNRDTFTAWLKYVYNQTTNKLNQFGTYDMAAYYLCLKDDRLKRPTSIGIHCSAFVRARMGCLGDANKVKVDYCLQHTFHDNDLGACDDVAKLAALAPAEVLKYMEEQDERRRHFVEDLIKSGRCQRIQRVAAGAGSRLFPGQKIAENSTTINDVTSSISSDGADDVKPWKRPRLQDFPFVASLRQPNAPRLILHPKDIKADPVELQKPKVDDVFLANLITQIDMECDLIQTRSTRLTTTSAAEKCLRYLSQARAALVEDPGCRRYLPRVNRSLSPIKNAIGAAKSSPSTTTRTVPRPVPPLGWTPVRLPAGLNLPLPWPKGKGAAVNSTLTSATPLKLPSAAVGSEQTDALKSNEDKAPAPDAATDRPPKLNLAASSLNRLKPSGRIAVNTGLVAGALRSNLRLVKAATGGKPMRTLSTPTQQNQCCECDVKHDSPLLIMMRCRQCRLVYHKQCTHSCKK